MRRRESNGVLSSAREPRRVVCLATPCSAGVDLIGALDLLTVTNTVLRTTGRGPGYAPEVVAAAPGAVTTLLCLRLQRGTACGARAEISYYALRTNNKVALLLSEWVISA